MARTILLFEDNDGYRRKVLEAAALAGAEVTGIATTPEEARDLIDRRAVGIVAGNLAFVDGNLRSDSRGDKGKDASDILRHLSDVGLLSEVVVVDFSTDGFDGLGLMRGPFFIGKDASPARLAELISELPDGPVV